MARKLIRMSINRVDLVDQGANQKAHIVLAKRLINKDSPSVDAVHVPVPIGSGIGSGSDDDEFETDYEKANLSADSRRNLPDSAFAAVWTDAQGKKHRKLPIHDAGHLAAARGRIDQANIPAHVKAEARHKIESHLHNKAHKDNSMKKKMTVVDLLKRAVGIAKEADPEKRASAADDLVKAIDEPGTPEHEAAEESHINALSNLHPDHVKAMKEHHAHLGKMIGDYGDGPHPDGHPVHALKAVHANLGKMLEGCEDGGQAVHGSTEKTMDADVTKRFTDLEKRAMDAEAKLQSEINKRLDSEMVAVLKSFKATPFNVDEADPNNDIKKFRKMQQADPDGFARTMTIFKAADDQLKQSALFSKNLGSSRSGDKGDAWTQIVAKAEQILEKDSKGLTREQAINKVMEANPRLVREYREQQQ